jgi:feruloyl esterase
LVSNCNFALQKNDLAEISLGNGGMAGSIDNSSMQLNKGFAVAEYKSNFPFSTAGLTYVQRNGQGAPGVYLPYLHDLNQIKTWIHDGIALFAQPSKTQVSLFYGKPARYNYYDGCSTGGAQGFALAQFYPGLFDGIVAGSPGNWYSHLALSFLWNGLKTQNESFIQQSKLSLITSAVLDECDELDGVKDNLIENPLKCNFDITSLAYNKNATNTSTCLTGAQVAAAQAVYAGPTSSIDGSLLYRGFSFGSETEWMLQEQQLSNAFPIPILQNLVKNNLQYDYHQFNFGSDVDEKAGMYINEISLDLSTFRNLGGKLLVTQGKSPSTIINKEGTNNVRLGGPIQRRYLASPSHARY